MMNVGEMLMVVSHDEMSMPLADNNLDQFCLMVHIIWIERVSVFDELVRVSVIVSTAGDEHHPHE